MTYNLLLSSAVDGLNTIVQEESPDVIAVQEIKTNKEILLGSFPSNYELADFSFCLINKGNLFGIATYYDQTKLDLIATQTHKLPFSCSDFLILLVLGRNIPLTMLKPLFEDKKTKKQFYFYNLHLSPYAGNGIRKKQMKEAFDYVEEDMPTIITGDFNFPYLRRDFEKIMKQFHLREATHTIDYSFRRKFMGFLPLNFKLDYILYKNIDHLTTRRLDHQFSDHFPLVADFDY